MFKIKNRSGEVIYKSESATSVRDAVEHAVKHEADLSGANLSWADLGRANLSGANLSGAYLSGANLGRANLSEADLSRANMSGANLSGANLSGADLSGADLGRANLSEADLSRANLSGANLSGANLGGADLGRANLSEADLSRANLSVANLSGAKSNDTTRWPRFQIPQEGELIVYKKVQQDGVRHIVKIRVPPEAKRTATMVGRKCRAEFVEVLDGSGVSIHDGVTVYAPGQIVRANAYDPDPKVECAGGIHFFLTREEAEEY